MSRVNSRYHALFLAAFLMALSILIAEPVPTTLAAPSETPVAAPCAAALHDSYQVKGPNGKVYPTWHPAKDPKTGCTFGHEHGDNPARSLANPKKPAFGYINEVAGHPEPHNGFKVFVVNRGDRNDEGRVATVSSRIVFHMGTGGVGRFTEGHHSMQYDLVAPDGHYVHVQGMADTGEVGSICDNPRHQRTVVYAPGTGCEVGSLYEVWAFRMALGEERIEINGGVAVFDPMTVMDPNDKTKLIKTVDVFGARFFDGNYLGCDREAYHGPVYWRNAGRSTVFYTDAHGDPGGLLRQEVSAHHDIGIPMNQDQATMKLRRSACAPGLLFPN